MKLPLIAILCAVSVFLSGCGGAPSPQLLAQLENAREKAGLRPVQPTWVVAKFTDKYIVWTYSLGGTDAKSVEYNVTGPIWEEDTYFTGRTFPAVDGDGTDFEMLSVHYDYKSALCTVHATTDSEIVQNMLKGKVSKQGVPVDQAKPIVQAVLDKWKINETMGQPTK